MKLGANYVDGKCRFTIWAPDIKELSVKFILPQKRIVPLKKDKMGYWNLIADNVLAGSLYLYLLNSMLQRPDPFSQYQPEGVHGPSQIIDQDTFQWHDEKWTGIPFEEMIMYEVHIGTFTSEGTFDAALSRIDELLHLGINTLSIMPVAQFPGQRNWGYDGVYLFAVQNSYGGPEGLKRLVNACHKKGMAVILDVVYNHLGPEGNYLGDFCPYFSKKYQTPWGRAMNLDDAYSDEVRRIFIENALYWFRDFHIDALRLDAIHALYDMSAKPFLKELSEKVEAFSLKRNRKFYLIAESSLNDVQKILPITSGGYGIDAQWCDDFHYALHSLLTGERNGYYADFGTAKHLEKAFREGFVLTGQYSKYRKRRHGTSSKDILAKQFVVFSQNHDHVGNRVSGKRLSTLISFEALKLAAGAVILSPYIPMLFMGEEYGEESPFLYFTSHGDSDLIKSVIEGRNAQFEECQFQGVPPNPQNIETFLQSKLKWKKRKEEKHAVLLKFYRELIYLRKNNLALKNLNKTALDLKIVEKENLLLLRRWKDEKTVLIIMNFNKKSVKFSLERGVRWEKILDSSETRWMGKGSTLPDCLNSKQMFSIAPLCFAVYEME